MTSETSTPVVLFDGECNFCSASINFMLKHEADHVLRFAPSRSEYGQAALTEYGLAGRPGSIVLIENGRAYTKSTASLRLARHMRRPWSWLGVFILIPAPIRDFFYGIVAKNRHHIARRTKKCVVPAQELRSRFLG